MFLIIFYNTADSYDCVLKSSHTVLEHSGMHRIWLPQESKTVFNKVIYIVTNEFQNSISHTVGRWPLPVQSFGPRSITSNRCFSLSFVEKWKLLMSALKPTNSYIKHYQTICIITCFWHVLCLWRKSVRPTQSGQLNALHSNLRIFKPVGATKCPL